MTSPKYIRTSERTRNLIYFVYTYLHFRKVETTKYTLCMCVCILGSGWGMIVCNATPFEL